MRVAVSPLRKGAPAVTSSTLLTAYLLVGSSSRAAMLMRPRFKALSHLRLLCALLGIATLEQPCSLTMAFRSFFELLCRRDVVTRTRVG